MKRTRRHAGVFAALFLVVALLSGLGVGLSGYVAIATTAGARVGLESLKGSDGGFRLTVPLASDPASQDREVRVAVRDGIRSGGTSVPAIVARDVVTDGAVPVSVDGAAPVQAVVAAIDDLTSSARLTSGSWPTSGQASVQADAARRLGLTVGEKVALPGGTTVTVSGLWRVRDPLDSRWMASPIATHGQANDGSIGWVVVTEPVIDGMLAGSTPVDLQGQWTIRPDRAHVAASQVGAFATAEERVTQLLVDSGHFPSFEQTGHLTDAVAPIQRNLSAATAASIAPLIVVAVLGVAMLTELARLLEQLRTVENGLIRARGASRLRLVAIPVIEAAVTSVPGAIVGTVAGILLLSASTPDPIRVSTGGWMLAAAPVLVAAGAFGTAAATAAREVVARPLRRSSEVRGRINSRALRSTLGIGASALLVFGAVLAVAQFLQYGSPLTPKTGGGVAIDPLAVCAPALAITAIGAITLLLFPVAARALERSAGRLPDIRSLARQQLARRSRSGTTPILLVSFAVSGLVLGASYSGTWLTSATETRAAQLGTDVRAESETTLTASLPSRVAGQTGAAPVFRGDTQLGATGTALVALPASQVARVVAAVPSAVDPAALSHALASGTKRPTLANGATGLTLAIDATSASEVPTGVSVNLVDRLGAHLSLELRRTATGFTAALPEGRAPWTVHGIVVDLASMKADDRLTLSLSTTGASSGAIAFDERWVPVGSSTSRGVTGLGRGSIGVIATTSTQGGPVLLQPATEATRALPILLSRGAASDSGLIVGDGASMTVLGESGAIRVRVVGVVPLAPGSDDGDGVLVDLASLQDAVDAAELEPISADQWWVATTERQRAAARLRAASPVGTVVETTDASPAARVLGSARVVVWISSAAIALLAFLAVGAGLLVELGSRRHELELLRALGMTPRAQATLRAREWGGLILLGVAAGLVNGFAVGTLLVPGLARIAVPDVIPTLLTTFRLDPIGGAVALLALGVGVATLLLIVAVGIRRQVRAPLAPDLEGAGAR